MPAGQAGHVGSAEHGVTAFMVLIFFWSWLCLVGFFFTLPVYFHQWTVRPGPVSPLTLLCGVEILNEMCAVVVVSR